MRRPALTPSRVLWLACVYLCLLPHLAAAEHSRTVDDRQRLSVPDSVQLVRSHGLQRTTDTDLDGDGAPALARIPPHLPPTEGSRSCAAQSAPLCQRSPAVQPFAPRPPPTRLPH